VVLDLFSRRVVGWAMADHLGHELALAALDMAIARQRPAPGLIHDSDRGVQLGFKRSSQHQLALLSAARQRPRQVFATQASCAAGC
jgi:putative transposase